MEKRLCERASLATQSSLDDDDDDDEMGAMDAAPVWLSVSALEFMLREFALRRKKELSGVDKNGRKRETTPPPLMSKKNESTLDIDRILMWDLAIIIVGIEIYSVSLYLSSLFAFCFLHFIFIFLSRYPKYILR